MWIPDRGEDERPAASRILALRTAGRLCGRTCAGLPRTLDNPPARAKWGATIRPPTTSPCARSLAPCRLDAPRLRFPPRELGRFGAAAAAAALRLHNRRLGGVLGRLKGRSSILGHYSGSNAWGVRTFRLGGCRESGWYANGCPRRYRAGGTLGASRNPRGWAGRGAPWRVQRSRGCPLPPEAIPNSPLALALPACVRPSALPPLGLLSARVRGKATICVRRRVRGAPPISPRAALSGTALLRINGEELLDGRCESAGEIEHPPRSCCRRTA